MTDIVERLRSVSPSRRLNMHGEAADEIERLRADNVRLSECETETWGTMKAELERLRTAAVALIEDIHRRYPGEELRCPLMRTLEDAINIEWK